MVKHSMRAAVLISVLVGTILLYFLDAIIALILTGFVATHLIKPEKRDYKVGGIAAGMLGILIFIYGFFIPLPFHFSFSDAPNASMMTLISGFIIVCVFCIIMGSVGGFIRKKFEKSPSTKPKRKNVDLRKRKKKMSYYNDSSD